MFPPYKINLFDLQDKSIEWGSISWLKLAENA